MPKARATRASAKPAARPAAKKAIEKKAPVKKMAKAAAAAPKAATKKQAVAPKQTAKSRSAQKSLDLCLILDCTGSMYSWIQRSKDTLREIIDHVRNTNAGLKVKVAFVAYRDVQDGAQRFDVTNFTEDIDLVKLVINKQAATGGGDFPEDVQGGFDRALCLSWAKDSVKMAFHIADAPGHGRDICDFGDNYPGGSPDGFKIQD